MPAKAITFYRHMDSVLSRPPPKSKNNVDSPIVWTFECLVNTQEESVRLHVLRTFLRSIVVDLEQLNKLKKQVEDLVRKIRTQSKTTNSTDFSKGKILYVWTYLPIPPNMINKGPSSLGIFNKIISHDLAYIPQSVPWTKEDNEQLKQIQKEMGVQVLERNFGELAHLGPIRDIGVHSVKCYTGVTNNFQKI
jgi:hypothetical protein